MTARNIEIPRCALDCWQIVCNRLGIVTLSFLTIFTLSAIITYGMPRKYRGRVEMTIVGKEEDARGEGHREDAEKALGDSFLKTPFEFLSKRQTLARVVEKMDLVKRWNLPNSAAAAGRLQGNLDAQSSVKSGVISIEYYDEDRQLAADIANSLAESYRENRIEAKVEGDTMRKLAPVYQELLVKREELAGSLGSKHPTMKSIEARLTETRRRLMDAAKTPDTVYQRAELENRPVKPNVSLNLALGADAGLLFGLGIAFFLECLEPSVMSHAGEEARAGAPPWKRSGQGAQFSAPSASGEAIVEEMF